MLVYCIEKNCHNLFCTKFQGSTSHYWILLYILAYIRFQYILWGNLLSTDSMQPFRVWTWARSLCAIWSHLSFSKGPADSSLLVSPVHKFMQTGQLLPHPWKSLPKDARDTAALSLCKSEPRASFPQDSRLSAGCCMPSYSIVGHLESISWPASSEGLRAPPCPWTPFWGVKWMALQGRARACHRVRCSVLQGVAGFPLTWRGPGLSCSVVCYLKNQRSFVIRMF